MAEDREMAYEQHVQMPSVQMGPKLIACSACAKAKAKCDRKVGLVLLARHLRCPSIYNHMIDRD